MFARTKSDYLCIVGTNKQNTHMYFPFETISTNRFQIDLFVLICVNHSHNPSGNKRPLVDTYILCYIFYVNVRMCFHLFFVFFLRNQKNAN